MFNLVIPRRRFSVCEMGYRGAGPGAARASLQRPGPAGAWHRCRCGGGARSYPDRIYNGGASRGSCNRYPAHARRRRSIPCAWARTSCPCPLSLLLVYPAFFLAYYKSLSSYFRRGGHPAARRPPVSPPPPNPRHLRGEAQPPADRGKSPCWLRSRW